MLQRDTRGREDETGHAKNVHWYIFFKIGGVTPPKLIALITSRVGWDPSWKDPSYILQSPALLSKPYQASKMAGQTLSN